MTLIDSKIDQNEIKRYLFAEMIACERDEFDERVFANDELFFEVADLENRLVDDYARGNLAGEDLSRFEQSMAILPARREKVANARALGEYIDQERPPILVDPPRANESLWQRWMNMLGGRTPAFGYGMAALLLILLTSTGILIFQNRQKNAHLARLQDQQLQQAELQFELDALRQRENELRNTIDAERDASGDLQDELDRERSRREEIERELGKVKAAPPPAPNGPIIASVVLLPAGGRGGSVPDVILGPDTKRLSMHLSLPENVTKDDRLTVRLNQTVPAKDVVPRGIAGKLSINVTVPTQNLSKGRNSLDIVDADGRTVGSYGFNVVNK